MNREKAHNPDYYSDALLGALLPPSTHPNRRLWRNYAVNALQRGALVAEILGQRHRLEGASVLDAGCGAGGTSIAMARRGAKVVAIDKSKEYIIFLREYARAARLTVSCAVGDVRHIQHTRATFDCIVLQDVLEHVSEPRRVLGELGRVLRQGGTLFISTPNRWSPLNMLADPHWQLPIVATLSRPWVNFVVTRLLGRAAHGREDLAALLSLRKLKAACRINGLKPGFVNRTVARAALINPAAVFSSELHMAAARAAGRLHVERILNFAVYDTWGFFNYFLNPTWYLIVSKE